eukprot:g1274.t1
MEDESPDLERTEDVAGAVDVIWIFVSFVLVVLMQAGFACYEVGTVRAASSTRPILLKNVGDATVSLAAWYLLGNSIAFGTEVGGVFGKPSIFLSENPFAETSDKEVAVPFLEFLYMWAFAATCTTIVSGAVADRIPFKAYIVYALLTSALFYPLLAHAVWAEEGWASSSRENPLMGCGVLDFAGSGVVHMLGGGISHFISRKVKSRPARFFKAGEWDAESNLKNPTNCRQLNEAGFRPNDSAWTTLGCFLLWIGWYGFNCGSTLELSTIESQNTAGRAAINTTFGAAFGGIFSVCFELVYHVWSPWYRKGEEIEDPLHEIDFDMDAELAADTEQDPQQHAADAARQRREREKLQREQLSDQTLRKISVYKEEHPGSVDKPCEENTLKWPSREFKWPFSTHMDLHGAAVNGILAGLVGITAGCATMSYHWVFFVSFMSALLYHAWYRKFICWMIDDAVSAGAVHLVCGAWGLIAAGFTGVEAARMDAGFPAEDECGRVSQLGLNLVAVVAIVIYAYACTWMIWGVLRGLKIVDLAEEGDVKTQREPEEITRLRDEMIQNDLQKDEISTEKEQKIDSQFVGLTNRVDDGDTAMGAYVQQIAALTERVRKLENPSTTVTSSTPGQTPSSNTAAQQTDTAAQQRAPAADPAGQTPSASTTPRPFLCLPS